MVKKVIEANPKAIEDFKIGKEQSLKFLVGQMMAQTRGAINPDTAKEIIKKVL